MQHMFHDCPSLTKLNLSSFNTSNVKDMAGMFYNNRSLTQLDLSNFDTSSVIYMDYMFAECQNLKQITMNPAINSEVCTDNILINCPAELIWNGEKADPE